MHLLRCISAVAGCRLDTCKRNLSCKEMKTVLCTLKLISQEMEVINGSLCMVDCVDISIQALKTFKHLQFNR